MKKRVFTLLFLMAVLLIVSLPAHAAIRNVALDADVQLKGGPFFTGGWGGGISASPGSVVDGAFLPRSRQWDRGPVWWDSRDGQDRHLEIYLGSLYKIESFVVQADDNDAYELFYWNRDTNSWEMAWAVPNYNAYGWGMQTRPTPSNNSVRYVLPEPIVTDAFLFRGNMYSGDRLFAVSEIQAFGEPFVIDFDEIAAPAEINEFYLDEGVMFFKGNGEYGTSTATSGSAWVYAYPPAAVSDPNVLVPEPGINNDIIVWFFDVNRERTTARYVSVRNDMEASPADIHLAAYDASDTLIDEVLISGAGTPGEISADNIHYVKIYSDPGSSGLLGVDDFAFELTPDTCVGRFPGLVSWWPGEGDAHDVVGSNDGILMHGASFAPGKVGQAFNFDGVDDFVNIPDSPSLGFGTDDFTVEFWVNYRNVANAPVLIEKYIETYGCPGRQGWTLTNIYDMRLHLADHLSCGGWNTLDVSLPQFSLNTWIFVAATRSGDTFKLYWNGDLIASKTFDVTLDLYTPASLKFGHRGNPNDTPGSFDWRGFYLNGLIDEVGLFNRALSQAEIQTIYNAGSAGICGIPNRPPVADAGPDQLIECPATQAVEVTLDGSASYDPDGDFLSYTWTEQNKTVTGLDPISTQTLPEWGTYTFDLTVEDIHEGSDADSVQVTVGDTVAPATTASVIGVKHESNGVYTSDVFVTLTSTDDCTGVKEIHYIIDDGTTSTEHVETFDPAVPTGSVDFTLVTDGTYLVTYWAVDDAGLAGNQSTTGSVSFTATPSSGGSGGGYYRSCVNVTLEEIDGGGEQLYYSLNGVDYLPYTGEFEVCQEATETPATVSYGYKAPSGNVERPKTLVIKIDRNPPELTCPLDVTVEQESFAGTPRNSTQLANFFASVSANDTVDGAPVITNNAPSTFPQGTTAVTFTATDQSGQTDTCGATVTVADTTAPEVHAGLDFTHSANTAGTYTVTLYGASVSDAADPAPSLAWTEGGVTLGTELVLTSSFGIGTHLLTLTATDASGNSASDEVMVTIRKRETLITYTGDSSGIYSDPYVLQAELLDVTSDDPVNGNNRPLEGVEVSFDIAGAVTMTATTNADGVAAVSVVWDWPDLGAGVHTVEAAYGEDEVFEGSSDTGDVTIAPEAVSLDYTGDQVLVISAETVFLRATVIQPDDGNLVDYVNSSVEVTFEIFGFTADMLTDPPLVVASAFLEGAGNNVATASASIPNPGEGLYTIRTSFAEHGYITAPNDESTLTVFNPDGQFFTGGGWVVETGSDEHQNFGFTFRFNNNEMPKGNIVHLKRSDDRLWRIKSNSLTGAGFVDSSKAQAQGRCNLQSIDHATGEVIEAESLGNLEFFLEVVDGVQSGNGADTYLLQIRDSNGLPVPGFFMDAPLQLQGGKIQVHGM